MKTILSLILGVVILSACGNTEKKSNPINNVTHSISQQEEKSVITSGKEIAENTFKTLGSNLKKAMSEGGVAYAINYCNANASHLIDSIGDYYYADIRRTSNKLRNPNNAPNKAEEIVLDKYLSGDQHEPIVDVLPSGNKVFYAPIKTKPLCTSCHGTVGETISTKDYATILEHYPNDKATDYKANELRGIWSIELKH